MNKFVAFLRGINVGGNMKVDMSRLKSTFESLSFMNVKTYINSGNVIFETERKDTDRMAEEIENTLLRTFGFSLKIILRDSKNIKKLCKQVPSDWANNARQKTDVLFLWSEYDSKKALELIAQNKEVDSLLYIPGSIVWHVDRENYNKSGMRKFIGTTLYKNMTARNVNTVRKLNEMLSA